MNTEARKARIAAIEAEQFGKVCVESILARGNDLLALHIKLALSGKGRQIDQYRASVEAQRG